MAHTQGYESHSNQRSSFFVMIRLLRRRCVWRCAFAWVFVLALQAQAADAVIEQTDASPHPRLRFQQQGRFGPVLVVDEGDFRYLRFGTADGDDQSVISLRDKNAVPMEYVRLMATAVPYLDTAQRALMIGLGGGTYTALLRRLSPRLHIDAVEIDPVVVQVAKRYFFVREDARYRIHLKDGRDFLVHSKQKYDLIALDAYSGDGIPEHLRGEDFFKLVRSHLTSHGVVVVNLALDDAQQTQQIVDELGAIFAHRTCLAATQSLNIVFIASPTPLAQEDVLKQRAQALQSQAGIDFSLQQILEQQRVSCPQLRKAAVSK